MMYLKLTTEKKYLSNWYILYIFVLVYNGLGTLFSTRPSSVTHFWYFSCFEIRPNHCESWRVEWIHLLKEVPERGLKSLEKVMNMPSLWILFWGLGGMISWQLLLSTWHLFQGEFGESLWLWMRISSFYIHYLDVPTQACTQRILTI